MISEDYLRQQKKLHERADYGTASTLFAGIASEIIDHYKVATILDYGAGKGRLGESIKTKTKPRLTNYDPAVEKYSTRPNGKFDLVASVDVLEHIEPEYLDQVLDDITTFVGRLAFLTIHIGPAAKVLDDGRNAHLIQKAPEWWISKIGERLSLQRIQKVSKTNFWGLWECK
jgi:2-polyprenyl-3-methyl-5-hydroxy-6-metoxy-1,4-benzoquinol methylase